MKIIIIDDDNIVTVSLKTILEATGKITVAALGHSGEEAIDLYRLHNPDVVLMDIRMDGMTGIDAGRIILSEDKSAKILFLTTFTDDEYIKNALEIGAKGYILNRILKESLLLLKLLWEVRLFWEKPLSVICSNR